VVDAVALVRRPDVPIDLHMVEVRAARMPRPATALQGADPRSA
jgi:hypothetical protein